MSTAGAWEQYWRRTREAAAHRGGGPQDEVLGRFWASFFAEALSRAERPRLLDVACGNGAVTRYALDASRRPAGANTFILGLDRSPSALEDFHKRYASVPGVVADARRTPFPDGCFDIVASQFGLEYAGVEAIEEAARLVSPEGSLAAVVHLKGGAIFRECSANLEAMGAVRDSGILRLTKDVFETGKAAERDPARVDEFRRVEARFAAAVQAVDGILERMGEAIAGGAVRRLYADIAQMYGRTHAYDAKEVAIWTANMASELEAYAQRMSGMLAAAVDGDAMDEYARRVTARGLSVRIREPLLMGVGVQEPAAWALVCDRR